MIKSGLILILFLGLFCGAFAQNITGNVVDGLDKEYLEEVWVINLRTRDSVETNNRGYFRIPGISGDSIVFKRSYYIPTGMKIQEQFHLLVEIHMNARMLPQVNVYGRDDRVPFRIGQYGNGSGLNPLSDREAGPGKIYSGLNNNEALVPALTIDGLFSYFLKSERQKRQYAQKLAEMARQQDYLDLIQSDSVMQALKKNYELSDQDLDDLIIEFNLSNRHHQFKDMPRKVVEQRLLDFFDRRTGKK
ncbi:hypothetical protein MM239_04320 [Belliella sp. DSM 111904]|uniref:CarboxypepD_reg-like domain-containing protein n=1 Tax=Belliella filtrata TaxID=2923435 RepID=A0ABS9UXY3_9BACT|nr:hypothetical protein [Belliella filtrata]MCH7408608.1 hypothetical protein [Belliella filtrata]